MRRNQFLRFWALILSLVLFITSIPETSFASSIPESYGTETEITEDYSLSDNEEWLFDDVVSEGETIDASEDVSGHTEEEQPSEEEPLEEELPAEEEQPFEEKIDEIISDNDLLGSFENDPMLIMPDAENNLTGDGEVSRLEWWQMLIEAFHLTVKADNYPDNYFADLSSKAPYYRDIMVATEFGLVDVPAGESVRVDDPVTREVAAYSLNVCLGIVNSREEYTFSESGTVTHPTEIQVAINEGWFELSGNKFLPEQPVTANEFNALKAIAEENYADLQIDENHENEYVFKPDVKVLGELDAELIDENVLAIREKTDLGLQVGDKFALFYGVIPYAYRAESIAIEGNDTIIHTSSLDPEDVFEVLDIEANESVDLTAITLADDTDVIYSYIVGGTPENDYEDGTEYFNKEDVQGKDVNAIKMIKNISERNGLERSISAETDVGDGLSIKLEIKMSNVSCSYSGKLMSDTTSFSVNGDIKASLTIKGKLSSSIKKKYLYERQLGTAVIPINGIATFRIHPELELTGKLSKTLKYHFGVTAKAKKGSFSVVPSMVKEEFSISGTAEIKLGIKCELVFSVLLMEGKIYFEIGIKGSYSHIHHIELDADCDEFRVYVYLNVGAEASIKLFLWKFTAKAELPIWDKNNSPIKIAFHIEDGHVVSRCTRVASDPSQYNPNVNGGWYYSPVDSIYGYGGGSGGIGADGGYYTIFKYSLDSYDRATITSYQGNVSALTIPDELDGYEVIGIGSRVFANNKRLKLVTIPDSVIKIGWQAFSDCSNLEDVTLSSNLEEMGYQTFRNCSSLTRIFIPKSLKNGGSNSGSPGNNGAFWHCNNLEEVTFETGITNVPISLFANCLGLKKIVIPNTVTSIGSQAFYNCSNLEEVTLPESLTTINSIAFQSCKMSKIVIPDSVTEIGPQAFYSCLALKELTLSQNLESMSWQAFGNCDSLTSIFIPKSLQSGGANAGSGTSNGAFWGCDNLEEVTFEEGTTMVAPGLFANCPGLEMIMIPNTVTLIGTHAFYGCSNLEEVTLPESLTTINSYAFQSCKIAKIVIPDNVTEIGTQAFYSCLALEELTLSKELVSMNWQAFGNCDSLTSIFIPKSLQNGGANAGSGTSNGAFWGCDNLEEVTFEEGTTMVASGLFANCPGLKKIMIPNTVTSIGSNAFYNCANLAEVTLSDSLITIGVNAFNSCKISEIKMPDSLTDINAYAFRNCQALKKISIPQSVSNIGKYAFADCPALEEAVIPEIRKNIVEGMFQNCSGLKKINLPAGLEAIRAYAFDGCSSLTEITVPEKVTVIEGFAFRNCAGLETINISDSVTTLASYCFDGCESLKAIKLGLGIKTIPTYCFSNCPSIETIALPYYCTKVDANAFKNDTKLKSVTVPRNVTTIANNAFSYELTIYGVPGTYAETFCKDNSLATFVARTVPVENISSTEKEITLKALDSVKLNYEITPADCTDIRQWKSSDTSIATVTDGVVKGISGGTAKVTLTVVDDSGTGKKYTWNIVVLQPVTSIYLNSSYLSLEGGETFQLNATVYPLNANNKEIEWSSSDTSVATVDNNGFVKAIGKGSCIIKAMALDGSGVSRSCEVEVTSNLFVVTDVNDLASPHPYGLNLSDVWTYTDSSLTEMVITFSEDTMLEEDSGDYIEIRDKNKYLVGKYIEDQLAGASVTVPGDTVYIKLVSDGFNSGDYGFAVINITGRDIPEPGTYTVTFDYLFNDIENTSVQVEPGQHISCPESPSRVGYRFDGWYTDKNFTTTFDFWYDVITEDTILYAKWTPHFYSIFLFPNYGDGLYNYVPCRYDEVVKLPACPFERENYRFVGWNTAPDGSGTYYADEQEILNLLTDNNDYIFFYAQWEKIKYTVIYKYNDGVTADVVTYVDSGTWAEVPAEPKREGYVFGGWYTDNNTFLNSYDFAAPITGNVTLYAYWYRTWNVVIKLNGGSFYNPYEIIADGSDDFRKLGDVSIVVKDSDVPMSVGEAINKEFGLTIDWSDAASIKPYKTGYVFGGWVDDKGNPTDFTADLKSDVTINATWTAMYVADKPYATVRDEYKTGDVLYEHATVKLASATPDAKIYYSTVSDEALRNGTSKTLYTDSIKVSDIPAENRFDVNSETGTYKVTIYAYAAKEGNSDSAVMSETFTVLSEDANNGDLTEEDKAEYVAAGKPDRMWVAGLKSDGYTYKGAAVTFTTDDIRVYDGKKLLKAGTDYALSYKNNTNAYTLTASDAGYSAAKAPTVTITGKGNYSGVITKTFIINPVDLSDASVTAADKYVKKTGKAIKAATTVTFTNPAGKVFTLKSGTDYVLQASQTLNPSFTVPGSYTVDVVGKYDAAKGTGNYKGTATFEFNVVDALISFTDKTVVFSDNFNTVFKALNNSNKGTDYDGSEKKLPEDEITVNGVVLEKGTDYTVRYLRGTVETDDFTLPGTVTAEYTGVALYTGTVKKTYKINALSLTKATFTSDYAEEYKELYNSGKGIVFDAREHYLTTDEILTFGGVTLREGTDYVVTYSADMRKVGTHTVTYTGKGGYTGSIKKSFKITAFNLANDEKLPEADRQITVIMPAGMIYVKGGAKPEPEVILNGITLEAGKDYALSYTNNTAVNTYDEAAETWTNGKKIPTLTITGKGNLSGKILRTFEIEKSTDISALSMVVTDKVYANKKGNFTTTVKLYDSDSKLLASGTDYEKVLKYYYTRDTELADSSVRMGGDEVGASDIVPFGTILRVEATLKGNYEGTISENFKLFAEDISKATVKVCNQIYTGREVCPDKSQIVVTLSGRVLAHTDYEIVSYSNNINKGTAKVTIKGVGDFGGEKTATFTIAGKSMQYVIVFNGNGATSGTMKDMALTPGKNYSFTVNAYKRTNYTFEGWNTRPDGTGDDYTLYVGKKDPLFSGTEQFINVTAEETGKTLILYAQWAPVEYSITYHLNGGTNNVLNTEVTYTADSQEIKIYAPEREDWPEGYQFGGWYKENNYKTRLSVIKAGSAGNLDLYAKWVPYTYTVSFDGNGATGSMDNETFSYGVAKKLLKNSFKKTGNVFMGWSTEPDGEVEYYDAESVTNNIIEPRNSFMGKVTLYAVWRDEFDVYFVTDGGTVPYDAVVTSGLINNEEGGYAYTYGTACKLPTPVKTGYTFGGWFSDYTLKKKVTSITKSQSGDVVLFAKWTANTYKIVFNAAAPTGTKALGSMKAQTVKYDEYVYLARNAFTLKGYNFAGWSTKPGADMAEYWNESSVSNLAPGGTINLYAVWFESYYYYVDFMSNGGSNIDMLCYEPGETFDLNDARYKPVRVGYSFDGWYKDVHFNTKISKITDKTYENMTLYAKWTPMNYKIVFDKNVANTGNPNAKCTGSTPSQSFTYGWIGFLNASGFTIPGYRFVEWNTQKDGSGISYKPQSFVSMTPYVNNEIKTLYAIWEPTTEYTVSFSSMGGSDIAPVSRKVNQALNLSTYVPTRDGYTFAGWYKDATLKTKMTSVAANVYSDITLYAKWTPKNYKVTFMPSAPEGTKATGRMSVQTLAYGTAKALTKNAFAIKGYNFLGWSTSEGDTEPEFENLEKITCVDDVYKEAVTLYAVWEKAEYGIVYNNVAGMDNSFNPDTYTVDDRIVLKEPEVIGDTFLGWYKDAKFSKRVYEIPAGSTGTITLYAKWEKTRYTINYNLNCKDENAKLDTSKAGYITSYDSNRENGYVLAKAIRPGYKFVGWYKEASCRTAVDNIISSPNVDMTVYAKWVEEP